MSRIDNMPEVINHTSGIHSSRVIAVTHRTLRPISGLTGAEAGVPPLTLSSALTAAALTHARDIAVQKRAWNFGSDRSAPQTRAERAGFSGLITGEDVAETFMSNIEIFQVWVSDSRSKQAMIDPRATHMGLGWYQEANGKLWWVMDIGALEAATAE